MTSGTEDTAVGEPSEPAAPSRPLQRLQTIGRYVVLDRLGAGGMGVVYAAYDPELDRKVALKVLHPTTSLRAQQPDRVRGKVMQRLFGDAVDEPTPDPADQTRLLREAQAAARISDPHVVTVHDVGQHEGRVFVAMEYVHGTTLTLWLAESKRTWRDIVRVMIDAGHGLAAAHDKGVVHRDFKPDNVMIGADGRVRVMDFGLAQGRPTHDITEEVKPTTDALAHVITRDGAVMGTPGYMSPEQYLARDTDARTDQFSFCVALWEALHGERPFKANSIAGLALAVTQGRREPAPADANVPAHVRRVLDRGLAVEPDARYGSMNALLEDLALDPSRARRVWFAGGVVVLAAAGGVGAWQLERVRTAERCDDEAQAVHAVWNEESRATLESSIRESGLAFAEATVERVHPWIDDYADRWAAMRHEACTRGAASHGHDADVAAQTSECLDERLASLESTLQALAQPSPHVVRRAVVVAADLPRLESCTDEAALARRTPLPDDPDQRAGMLELRRVLSDATALEASGDYAKALEIVRDAGARAEELGVPALVVRARYRAGALHERMNEADAAIDELTKSTLLAAEIGEDEDAAEAAARLAVVYARRRSSFDVALVWATWAETFLHRIGADEELVAASILNQIGIVDQDRGASKEALARHERALAIKQRILGPSHPDVALSVNNVGTVRSTLGDFDGAERDYEAALAIFEEVLGPDHPDTAMPLVNLAEMHWRRGRLGDARASMERALAIQEAAYGSGHPQVAASMSNLGMLLGEMGDHAGALALHERSLAILEATLGPEHPRIGATLGNLADAQRWLGGLEAARKNHERALAMLVKLLGPDHSEVALQEHGLGTDLRVAGDLEGALEHHRRAAAIFEKQFGPEHPNLGPVLAEVGRDEVSLGKFADARATLQRAVALLDQHEASAERRGDARLWLARALWESDPARAREIARDAKTVLADAGEEAESERAEVEQWLAEHAS